MYHPQDEGLGAGQPAEAPTQVDGTAAGAARPTHVSVLLAEIARAMQAAAAQERERIHAGVGEEEATQIEKVRARAAAELAALKQGADDDMRRVESWCDEQIQQIRLEASRRIEARGRELELSVSQHGSLIESEEQSVHGAVAGYRESLDEFFARLAAEDQPSAIAGLAGTLPDTPDLDAVRADARSRAMRALEEQEAAQASSSTDEGPTTEGPASDGPTGGARTDESPTNEDPTTEGPTDLGPTDEAQIDAPGTVPPSVEELVPVMEPESVEDPVPVMDPAAAESTHENVAFRVLHSLTSRTSPTPSPGDKGSGAQP